MARPLGVSVDNWIYFEILKRVKETARSRSEIVNELLSKAIVREQENERQKSN